MKKVTGKIILIDDQKHEKSFLQDSLIDNNWAIEVEYFSNATDALKHLRENADDIFLIISDMNMPEMSGMEFKKTIDEDPFLRQKAIPFIFASSLITKEQVTEAYEYRVQGFFRKPETNDEQSEMLEKIVQYWKSCIHPNKKFSKY
ncbi:MAG: response regulator [Brumimicrobium sp.]